MIERRAKRYFGQAQPRAQGSILVGDSTKPDTFAGFADKFDWIITSPPYYGMRTYIPDQWLRLWFLGGSSDVDYSNDRQLSHGSQNEFVRGLREVWLNCAQASNPDARLIIRFGSINDRKVNPLELLKKSLEETPWKLKTARSAGTAHAGKRQADHFTIDASTPITEYDAWARLEN